MARLDWNGQIQGQLELPDEITRKFHLPGRWAGRSWQLEPGHTVTLLPDRRADRRRADRRRAPKAPKIHWHDWMREQTKPWCRLPDQTVDQLLAKYRKKPGEFEYEVVPDTVHA